MINEGIIIGVIIAFDLDRDGNQYVIRGSLEFLGKPMIKYTSCLLEKVDISSQFVYTNQKGIVFKKVLEKNIKYIVRKNNYLYTNNNVLSDFKNYLVNVNHILIFDPKYPLFDDTLLKELIEKHKHCYSDLTYIKGLDRGSIVIPNVFVIDKLFFEELFVNEFYPKNIEINYLIKIAVSLQKKLHFIETVYVYKIAMISNKKSLDILESILINRK